MQGGFLELRGVQQLGLQGWLTNFKIWGLPVALDLPPLREASEVPIIYLPPSLSSPSSLPSAFRVPRATWVSQESPDRRGDR